MKKVIKRVRTYGLIFSIECKGPDKLLNYVWVGDERERMVGTIDTKHQARTLINILKTTMPRLSGK